mgnify:FL=1
MKIAEVISTVDRLCNNKIDSTTKINWLRRLDRQIKEEVLDTHVKPEGYTEPDFENYGMDTELIVPDIYGELYESFLKMKIALEHAEEERYAMEQTNYNNFYITYQAFYNRNHMPLNKSVTRYR